MYYILPPKDVYHYIIIVQWFPFGSAAFGGTNRFNTWRTLFDGPSMRRNVRCVQYDTFRHLVLSYICLNIMCYVLVAYRMMDYLILYSASKKYEHLRILKTNTQPIRTVCSSARDDCLERCQHQWQYHLPRANTSNLYAILLFHADVDVRLTHIRRRDRSGASAFSSRIKAGVFHNGKEGSECCVHSI